MLATNINALDDLPPFPASIMDGYAVTDLDFSQPFDIIDTKMLAGVDPGVYLSKTTKQAIYVTTGGPVPEGFVAVVPIEEVTVNGKTLDLTKVDAA